MIPKILYSTLTLLLCFSNQTQGTNVAVFHDPANASSVFAVSYINGALQQKGHTVTGRSLASLATDATNTRIVVALTSSEPTMAHFSNQGGTAVGTLKTEGYSIRITKSDDITTYWSLSDDPIGAMYGGLEIRETILNSSLAGITSGDHNPFHEKRGLKMNIPLDARTPSYADAATGPQENIAEMWSWDFWTDQLDKMALNRYNTYTLWSLHPFPSLVKLENFPNVALDDVMVADIDWVEKNKNYSTLGTNMVDDNILANLKNVKEISIEDKIKFWQDVMQYAFDRGITFHIYTWNIFTWGADGKDGIKHTFEEGDDWQTDATLKKYFRESVRDMFLTYPLLRGMGITAAEGFVQGQEAEKEKWLWDTYGEGIMDVRRVQPNRTIEFVHRVWWTDVDEIYKNFSGFDDGVIFNFSYKYAMARIFSFSDDGLKEKNKIGENLAKLQGNTRYWWNLRNDDIFNFRWGDPDYVKEFMETMPSSQYGLGFHMGSDGYVWGREYTSKDPETPRMLEHDKHWYNFMLWGRLGYDPNAKDEIFAGEAGRRLPGANISALRDLWHTASKIVPAVNRYHWHDWDFQWSVEYSKSRILRNGFHALDETKTKWSQNGGNAVATELAGYAKTVLDGLPALRGTGGKELRRTLGDMEAFSHLGNYYSEKILAAIDMAANLNGQAVAHATRAAEHFRKYAAVATSKYSDQILGRARSMNWKDIFNRDVLQDIYIAGGSPNLAPIPATPGGTILEAEDATFTAGRMASANTGFTGTGYVNFGNGKGSTLTWNYTAPAAGEYILEFRYALDGGEQPMAVSINNVEYPAKIRLWNTSGDGAWAWDRKMVSLKAGANTIKIAGLRDNQYNKSPSIDHVNVLYYGDVVP